MPTVIVLVLGPLLDRVPIASLQLDDRDPVAALLGMGWLRKASGAAGHPGVIPLHDKEAVFAAEAAELSETARRRQRNCCASTSGITALKAVLLRRAESRLYRAGGGGAPAPAVDRARGPRRARRLRRGSRRRSDRPPAAWRASRKILSNSASASCWRGALAVFWTGEGLGIAWPGQDLALLLFAALFLGAGLLAAAFARKLAMEFA